SVLHDSPGPGAGPLGDVGEQHRLDGVERPGHGQLVCCGRPLGELELERGPGAPHLAVEPVAPLGEEPQHPAQDAAEEDDDERPPVPPHRSASVRPSRTARRRPTTVRDRGSSWTCPPPAVTVSYTASTSRVTTDQS